MTSVLHVLTRTNVGGPSVILRCLLDEAERSGDSVTVARGSTPAEEGDYFTDDPRALSFHHIPGLGRRARPLDDLLALVGLVRLMRRIRPHVVHTHMAKAGALGRVAAVVARVPVRVHTFHGHLLTGYFSPFVTRLVVIAERLLRRVTTHAIVVGEAVRRDLIRARIVEANRSSVVPPCVRPPDRLERADAKVRLGLDPTHTVVGFIGRLTGVKRPDRFVEIARRAQGRLPRATFLIVGDGPLAEETKASASSLPNVSFLGWRRDIDVVLSACDVIVLCSDNEGMPVVLIEAALLGTPAVAARVGSVPEVVDDGTGGILVEPSDVEGYVEAIDRILSGRAHLEPERAAQRARDVFGPATIARAHGELYRRLTYKRS